MKVLVVGLGAVGQRHCRNIRDILGDSVELMVLRSRCTSPALNEKLEAIPGIDPTTAFGARAFFSVESAFAERPQAVIVANPSSLHLAVARAAAEADCAVFVEKPLSHSWDGVPEFLSLVERKKLTTFVDYQWRFHPLIEWLRSYLESQPLGSIITARVSYGEYLPDWHPYEDYRKSYAANRQLGGGVLLTQIHDFDYVCWLLGWPRETYTIGGRLSNLEIDVEDVAETLMRCPSNGREIPVSVHHDYLQRPPVRSCELIAEGGRILVDLANANAKAMDAKGHTICEKDLASFSRNDMFLAAMRHFLSCVGGREQSVIPAREGARSLAVALAALRSLGSGRPETVMYP